MRVGGHASGHGTVKVAGMSATLSHMRNGMEIRVMRNICLVLLGSSLLLSQTTLHAEELLADANTNFGPAHPAGVETNQPPSAPPKSVPAAPANAPAPAPKATPPKTQPAP